ncbi:DUF6685 family protein [Duganella sp. LjRoot269]|uniref:DUF6685 family protein n=1 Tax=Duganella sp. LjRoot269 TaxID=3342305 RepID=UPI003ECDE4B3
MMRSILQALFDGAREDLGYPASLIRLLRARPDTLVEVHGYPASIYLEDVPDWTQLTQPIGFDWGRESVGELAGWRNVGSHYYESFTVRRPEYERLIELDIHQNFNCDIQQVHGFSASKTNLKSFTSMEAMAIADSPELIAEISESGLARVMRKAALGPEKAANSDDYFVRHSWHGPLYLVNDDGSHHFAAAKTIAGRLKVPVRVAAPLHSYRINPSAVQSLEDDFDMFVISDDAEISNAFHEAMERFKATYLWHRMPRPFDETRAILLPKSEKRSRRVAQVLREASITDLGKHLRLYAEQKW